MADVSGYVVLSLPVELSEDILQCEDDEVPLHLLCSLLESAGLNANLYRHKVTSITDSTEYMEMDLSGGLGLEEKAEYIGGYTVLRVWGGDRIALSHILANNSKSLEIYAKIRDDDGFLFLNGRNALDENFEYAGEDSDFQDSIGWNSFVSVDIKSKLPQLLLSSNGIHQEGGKTKTYRDTRFSIDYPSDYSFNLRELRRGGLEWCFNGKHSTGVRIYTIGKTVRLKKIVDSETIKEWDDIIVREHQNEVLIGDDKVKQVIQQYYFANKPKTIRFENRILILTGPKSRYAVVAWKIDDRKKIDPNIDKIVDSVSIIQ
jgi:hypothetical protein